MVSKCWSIFLLIINIIGFCLGVAAAIVFYFVRVNEPAVVLSILVAICSSLNIYLHWNVLKENLHIYSPDQLSSMSLFGFVAGMAILWLLIMNILRSYSSRNFSEYDIIVDVWLFILMKHLFLLFSSAKAYSRMLIISSRPLLHE